MARLNLEIREDSKVLDCGIFYSELKSEIRLWLRKNIPRAIFGIDDEGYYLLFKTEQDRTNFTMVWL